MISLTPTRIDNNTISSDLFGGNILATRDKIGENGTYDEVADKLGVETIRYPGGSLTEQSFDISNPDKGTSFTGDYFLKYSDFMEYAEASSKSVTIVLPTKNYLSENSDNNGDRFSEIDEDTLRQFICDTLDGQYGRPEIRAFELGNEYWGSGEMSSVEYGRVASEMALIIRDEVNSHPNYNTEYFNLDIIVQMGNNYGEARLNPFYDGSSPDVLSQLSEDYNFSFTPDYLFSNGTVNWTKVANQLIINQFNEDEIDSIDGIVAHVYSKGTDTSRTFDLSSVEQTWHQQIDGLTTYVTEWNQSSKSGKFIRDEDYGLKQDHEMLETFEELVAYDVEIAHVWPLQQNTKTDLSGDEGSENLTVGGAMFQMMSNNLVGMRVLDLNPDSQTELESENFEVHSFYDDNSLLFYIYSTSKTDIQERLDFSNLISGYENVVVNILGVREGDTSTSPTARPVMRDESLELVEENELLINLQPYEVMQVKIVNPEYSDLMNSIPYLDEENEYVFFDDVNEKDNDDFMVEILSGIGLSFLIGLMVFL